MTIGITAQLQCALREVGMRERVYPKWVAAGKMTQEKADYEIAAMRSIVETLRELASKPPAVSNAGLDDAVRYWLCCGSTIYPHGAESCYEAQAGHPERVRFGTAKEHSEWQRNRSSNV